VPLASALRQHWPEYLMEAAEIALFMISALAFTVLLEHPASPLRAALPDAFARRVLMGLAMGATAVAIVYSPIGKQSGAHFNPAVTLTFLRLGKVACADALFYVAAQLAGAIAGVAVAAALLGAPVAAPEVRYAVTVPGMAGIAAAFAAELAISFVLMLTILVTNGAERLAPYTGCFAAALVATYIAFEAPLSGMSMNPARTLGSAVGAQVWTALWLYLTAPVAGMLAAAQVSLWLRGRAAVHCAKLHHQNAKRCIFCGAAATA
jgi:aquaporin Z